ncbi:flagellar type III secretion system protein FlhB [Chachezhania sediminis]|uniref:flagellar type III secretion system protein FlhB n=1 Tax=Chachezhania sediminis TaxID=2599291 RepID=UPI00131BBC89|nr:flagellar type III secretion system protein FlhB [Chachezhania sediminis]
MSEEDDESQKVFDPTPEKLRKAREKGDVAKSVDLSVAATYAGVLVAGMTFGAASIEETGRRMAILLDRAPELSQLLFEGAPQAPLGGIIGGVALALAPWFGIPAAAVLISIVGQQAFVVAPSKLEPKMSRISIMQNAKNKFGRSGLFEFGKSLVKLVLYSVCLGLLLETMLPEMIGAMNAGAAPAAALMVEMCRQFLFIVVLIAAALGIVDALFQQMEHQRKNRMTRKEVMDETKDSEGDPHIKSQRRQRGQEIAMSQMMAEVPKSDVVIVNPTHYAVALKWDRKPGTAPVCVAKGVDEMAASIRRTAAEAGVPIHLDPPTARALHATTEMGQEVSPDHYAPVAAAIRFAEAMRKRAKMGV